MDLITVFDTETTGLPDWKEPSESEKQPHIVQLAALLVNPETWGIAQTINLIVKPEGRDIPEECAQIHGITTEYATKVGLPEETVLRIFLDIWAGRKRVAHNTTFDNRIIRIATKRFCDEATINAWKEGEYECTGLLSKPILKLKPKNRYGFKMPKLEEACKHFTGKDLVNAHDAYADTTACLDVYRAIKNLKEAA